MKANLNNLTTFEGLVVKNLMKQRLSAIQASEVYRIIFETLKELDATKLNNIDFILITEIIYITAFKENQSKNLTTTSEIWSIRFREACKNVIGQYINNEQAKTQTKLF